jgi:spore germination cell wall hydrolase CwlJ-like protein
MTRIFTVALAAFLLLGTYSGVSAVTKHKINTIKKVEHVNQKSPSLADRERQLACLAKNIYFEAGSEPFEGKVAVAQVTLNRAKSGKFPNDICKVVYQKTVIDERIVCQFSWHCENGPVIRSKEKYVESMEVAKKVLLENFRLPSLNQALYFHADYIKNPKWGKPVITKIGRHIFYGDNS